MSINWKKLATASAIATILSIVAGLGMGLLMILPLFFGGSGQNTPLIWKLLGLYSQFAQYLLQTDTDGSDLAAFLLAAIVIFAAAFSVVMVRPSRLRLPPPVAIASVVIGGAYLMLIMWQLICLHKTTEAKLDEKDAAAYFVEHQPDVLKAIGPKPTYVVSTYRGTPELISMYQLSLFGKSSAVRAVVKVLQHGKAAKFELRCAVALDYRAQAPPGEDPCFLYSPTGIPRE